MNHYNHFVSLEEEVDTENLNVLSEISQSDLNMKHTQNTKEDELKGLKESLLKSGHKEQECESDEKPVTKQKYPASLDLKEPLCIESKNRFVLFPIANQEVCSFSRVRLQISGSTLTPPDL